MHSWSYRIPFIKWKLVENSVSYGQLHFLCQTVVFFNSDQVAMCNPLSSTGALNNVFALYSLNSAWNVPCTEWIFVELFLSNGYFHLSFFFFFFFFGGGGGGGGGPWMFILRSCDFSKINQLRSCNVYCKVHVEVMTCLCIFMLSAWNIYVMLVWNFYVTCRGHEVFMLRSCNVHGKVM